MRRRNLTTMLLSCASLSACASRPEAVVEAALTGSWRSADGVTVAFEETGVMLVDIPGPKAKSILGEWSVAEGVTTIRYRPESRMCVDDVGQYRMEVAGDSLTMRLVRESCDQRRKAFEGVWKRTAAARPLGGR